MALVNLNKRLDMMDRGYLRRPPKNKAKRRLLVILIIFFIALLVPSIFIFFGVKETASHAKALVTAYKAQDFDNLRKEVSGTKKGLQKVNFSLGTLFWFRAIPILGGYYWDAKGFAQAGVEELTALDKLLSDLESSKAELGFDGHPKSGPDRVVQVVKLLDKSIPLLDKIEGNLKKGADSVKNIDTNKYPQTFKGKEVKKNLQVLKNFILGAAIAVGDGKQALMAAPQA
ncbi:MAG: hypothetical protein Q8Q91_02150, partial [Candidatus Daviesbacteria bacterium]|nr:hypothetical protein [Candidatus Daviesbacteria bacterium]